MIIDHIYQWARVEPFKAALIHDDHVIDYIGYAKSIESLRRFFAKQALPAGTIAIVLVKHLAAAWGLDMALRSLGLATIQVNSLAAAKSLQLKNVSCVVTTAAEQPAHGLAGEPWVGARLIVASSRDLAATSALDSALDLPALPQRNFGGHILYTSGTTGDYKKLMWDSEREEARTSARARARFNKDTVLHAWAYGQWTGPGWKNPLSVWRSGGCVVFDQRPDWDTRFFHHPVNAAVLLPAAFRQLMEATHYKPNHCEFVISGDAASPASIAKAIAIFGNCITHTYNSSELNTPALISRIRNQDDALWLELAADRTVQLVGDDGAECLPGREGNLRVGLTELDWHCYYEDEQATAKVFRDGFFYPGDRAVKRADGRIRILGRVADVLNIRGQKFAVGPIEQQIRQHLEIEEVCVFSGLDAASEVEVVIAIESDHQPSQDKLDFISGAFADFDKVRFAVLREFPRTEAGKVRRAELRKVIFSEPGHLQSRNGIAEYSVEKP
jgi:acyl-coenzyme A synthetase/AMP-(fatty) acid ligase